MKKLTWIIIALLTFSLASALGVGIPKDNTINFVPGGTETIPIIIINDDSQSQTIKLELDSGILGDNAWLKDYEVTTPGSDRTSSALVIKFPESLPTGKHTIFVRATQGVSSGGLVATNIAIKRKLFVLVPEVVKKKSSSFEITSTFVQSVDNEVKILVKVKNPSTKPINTGAAVVLEQDNKVVAEGLSTDLMIGPGEEKTLETSISKVEPGQYKVKGTVKAGSRNIPFENILTIEESGLNWYLLLGSAIIILLALLITWHYRQKHFYT